jgi:hypothetical protein
VKDQKCHMVFWTVYRCILVHIMCISVCECLPIYIYMYLGRHSQTLMHIIWTKMHRYTVQNTMWHFWSFTSEFSLHAAGSSSQFKALGNSDWFTGCLSRKYSETKHRLVLKRWTGWSKHVYYFFIPTKAETYLGYLGVSWGFLES